MQQTFKEFLNPDYWLQQWHNIPYGDIEEPILKLSQHCQNSVDLLLDSCPWDPHRLQNFVVGQFCPCKCNKECFKLLNYLKYLQKLNENVSSFTEDGWIAAMQEIDCIYEDACQTRC